MPVEKPTTRRLDDGWKVAQTTFVLGWLKKFRLCTPHRVLAMRLPTPVPLDVDGTGSSASDSESSDPFACQVKTAPSRLIV